MSLILSLMEDGAGLMYGPEPALAPSVETGKAVLVLEAVAAVLCHVSELSRQAQRGNDGRAQRLDEQSSFTHAARHLRDDLCQQRKAGSAWEPTCRAWVAASVARAWGGS